MGLGRKTTGRDRKETRPFPLVQVFQFCSSGPCGQSQLTLGAGAVHSFSLLIKTRWFNICRMVTFLRPGRIFWSSCFGLYFVSWKSIMGDLRPLESSQGVSDPRIRTLFCVTLKKCPRASFWLTLLHIPQYCSINIHHSPDVRLYYMEMGI